MPSDKETLIDMGFESEKVDWALRQTKNSGLQPALDFLFAHPEGPPEGDAAPESMDVDEDEDAEALKALVGQSAVGGEQVEAKSIKCSQCGKVFKNTALANFHAEKSGHDQFEESTDEIKPLTEEEKAARLAELKAKLAEKRAAKSIQEAQEAKENEAIRRKSGKDAGKALEDLKKKETLKQAERLRLEKIEDAKAREEIKRKIAEDQAERRARAEKEKALREGRLPPAATAPDPSPAAAAPSNAEREYGETKLQIRLSGFDKSAVEKQIYTTSLPSESKLSEVAEFLAAQTLAVDAESVKFSTPYPRKDFQPADFSKTLKELGLVHSVALIASI